MTVTVFGDEDELDALEDAGYEIGATIEGPSIWRERSRAPGRGPQGEARRRGRARATRSRRSSHEDEIVVLRADYFENYAGRFLSVEAKTALGGAAATGRPTSGPTLSLSWNTRRRHADRLHAAGR